MGEKLPGDTRVDAFDKGPFFHSCSGAEKAEKFVSRRPLFGW
jgi:hypothetical protein